MTEHAIATVMIEAPILAATIYWKAKQNPAGKFECQYIEHYNKRIQIPIIPGFKKKLVSKEQIAILDKHLKDLEANKPLTRPVSDPPTPVPGANASTSGE